MDGERIRLLLRARCRGIFLGVFASNTLPRTLPPKRPLVIVCNTDPAHKPGEHWVAIFVGRDSRGEYFDSYGQPPSRCFETWLNKHCVNWTRNSKRLQSVLSGFCGHYCVFYCLYKRLNYSMTSILNCFTDDTALNDWIVHKFVCDGL